MFNKSLNYTFLICIKLLLSYNGTSQYFNFSKHEISDELIKMEPSMLFRFDDEMLWIGTAQGLVRYDGEQMEVFIKSDQTSEQITTIARINDEYWIGYADGSIYSFNNETLKPVDWNGSRPDASIKSIIQNVDQTIWVSTYGDGIYHYQNKLLQHLTEDDGLLSDEIYSMVYIPEMGVFLATDQGIQLCKEQSGKLNLSVPSFMEQLPSDIITTLHYDNFEKILWVGTYEHGLYSIRIPDSKISIFDIGKQRIDMIRPYLKTGMMIGTLNHTDFILHDTKSKKNYRQLPVGSDEKLNLIDFMLDQNSIIWVLCKNIGLFSADALFMEYKTDIRNVQSLIQVDSLLYISDENGLYTMDMEGNFLTITKKLNILSLCYDALQKTLYCGTLGKGVLVYKPENKSFQFINEKNGLINDNVLSLIVIDDVLWVATLGGISKINLKTLITENITKEEGLTTGYNYRLYKDKKANIWIGSDGYGLIKIGPDGVKEYFKNKHKVYAIAQDKHDNIWYSTPTEGVMKLSNDSILVFDKSKGLADNHVQGIISDFHGNMVLFYPKGLQLINVETNQVSKFGHLAGIHNLDLNMNAYTINDSGEIWFYAKNHIIKFQSRSIYMAYPKLVVKKMSAGNKNIMNNLSSTLDHNDNDFLIDFAGVWYDEPAAMKYRYRMEGFDSDWKYTKDKKLIYSNLPTGNFKFVLESSAEENFLMVDRIEKKFEILPPIWKTPWFIFIIFVSLTGIGILLLRNREKNRQQLEMLKTEQIRSQLEILKSQINPHFLFNSFNTLISAIETDSESAVKYAERMSDFYRNIIEYRDKDLISLKEELEIADDYLFLLESRFGNNLKISIHVEDKDNYLIVPLTLQILIENAIKHNIISKNKPLFINIHQQNEFLVVSNNNQTRIETTVSTHFGLQTLQKQYSTIVGKSIQISTQPQHFSVSIPLKTNKK